MFEDTNIIAGVEIGTSKICVVIGERKADGSLSIIGVGQAASHGVRKGEIVDPKRAEEELREALAEAEQMADVEIRGVYLGITGNHIRGFNHRGVNQVVSPDNEIFPEDVQEVVHNARAINLPMHHVVIHSMRQFFVVDGEAGVVDPVGMHGNRLEVDLHVVHGRTTRLQNSVRLVRSTSLVVEDMVFNGVASALALLTPEQKDLGALVIDLGAGTTDYAVYAQGIIRHTGVLAVGMDHVTNDLAFGLKISLARANKLMREEGSAVVIDADREKLISVSDERGLELKRVKAGHLQAIMAARLEEIFQIIREDVDRAQLGPFLRAGVVLGGGGSRVSGIVPLAERIFQMDVNLGHVSTMIGMAGSLDQPEFATAIGLVKYGSLRQPKPSARISLMASATAFIRGLLDRLQQLMPNK
jgi:cell division protein FtsA